MKKRPGKIFQKTAAQRILGSCIHLIGSFMLGLFLINCYECETLWDFMLGRFGADEALKL